MNPKHAPALATVPASSGLGLQVPDCKLTAGAMSIKQQEQQFLYGALQKVNSKF